VITEELTSESESAGQAIGDATFVGQYVLTGQRMDSSLTQYLPAGQMMQVQAEESLHFLNQPPPQVQLLILAEPEGE
jgi:hypothetical protein